MWQHAHDWLGADHPGGDKGRGASTFRAQYQDCSTIERDALLEYANSSIALVIGKKWKKVV
jgi:hypothetical protein